MLPDKILFVGVVLVDKPIKRTLAWELLEEEQVD
jgi:hypothetical protein